MDGTIECRKTVLLRKLRARTQPDGTAKANYSENVAAIRAELQMLERNDVGRD